MRILFYYNFLPLDFFLDFWVYSEYKCRFCCRIAVWYCWGKPTVAGLWCSPRDAQAALISAIHVIGRAPARRRGARARPNARSASIILPMGKNSRWAALYAGEAALFRWRPRHRHQLRWCCWRMRRRSGLLHEIGRSLHLVKSLKSTRMLVGWCEWAARPDSELFLSRFYPAFFIK